jgi:hypothetical protein
MREAEDALLIPAYAVIEQDQSNKVFILIDGNAESKSIRLGADFGETVEVISGLEVGDSLIVAGQHKISDGDRVRLLTEGAD